MPLITAQQPLQPSAPKPEVQAPEPAKEPPKDERLSSNFAALAKQTKALRQAQEKFKKERDEWETSKKSMEEKYSKDYIPKERLSKETVRVLSEELGMTQDQMTKLTLALPNEQQAMVQQLLGRIDQLEAKTKSVEEQFSQRDKQNYDQAVNQIRSEVKIMIDSDPEYETIKETNSIEDVVKRIEETFEKDGIVLSVEEAAKKIEQELIEDAVKIAGLRKVRERLQPAPDQLKQQNPQQQQPIRTLTQDLTAPAKPALSAKLRRERAILRAQGLDPDTGKPVAG